MNRKKNIYRYAALSIFIAIFATGCTSPGDLETTWLGRDAEELIAAWGRPDSMVTLKDGGKVMTWESYDNPNQVVPCRQAFTVSADGKIEKFTSSNCASTMSKPTYRPRAGGTIR